MKPIVAVVDYGMGNLFSVTKALEHCGARVTLSSDPKDFIGQERIVLPGVGAFSDGMKGLRERGLVEILKQFALSGGKFLGICLGMQMLMETSEEFGAHEGLGLIPGSVTAIEGTGTNGKPHKIPHVGWTAIHAPAALGNDPWRDSLLARVTPGESMYFVHSFTPSPVHEHHRLADSDYDGRRISAVIRNGNTYGCQFHPEKSGRAGLKIIEQFLKI